eukprot:gene525-8037_t
MSETDILKKQGLEVTEKSQLHKINISLTSRNVKNLEKVCADLVREVKKKGLKVRGPVRYPTRILRITTRKTPCGEGTATWDKYEMRIHKRLISLQTTSKDMTELTSITIEPNVLIDVSVSE